MSLPEGRRRVVIMGAAGRDFHNFNVVYRHDPHYEVVAFTAAQTPGIADRLYPPTLSGPAYPEGIPIVPEAELAALCRAHAVNEVVFAYSDVKHEHVMHRASTALANGADFVLLGPQQTMLKADRPVIAVSAVRTGCGKSPTSRWLSAFLSRQGLRTAVMHHPMPYGDLERQIVQRFANLIDLEAGHCTIEEREDYEPHLKLGNVVYGGVDYTCLLPMAEAESDIILWEGANSDFPFLEPDLHIVLVDPLRLGHETAYHPAEAVLQMADIVVIAKACSAPEAAVTSSREAVRKINPRAEIVLGAFEIEVEGEDLVRGSRVLVIEDGLSMTLGELSTGAGYEAALRLEAGEILDPRAFAAGALRAVYQEYPHLGPVLPALGYSNTELKDLQETIAKSNADVVIVATPADLRRVIDIAKPTVRVRYEFAEIGEPKLSGLVGQFLDRIEATPRNARGPA